MSKNENILITTSSFNTENNAALSELQSTGLEIITNPYGRRLTEEDVTNLITPSTVGMIAGVEPLTRRFFTHASSLRVVSRCGIGIDSVDVEAARDHGIAVLNTPDAPTDSVAELTLGLMLSLLRKIPQSDSEIRLGNWNRSKGNLLSAQKVGIVGYGRIGKAVARLLSGFGSQILVHDPFISVNGTEKVKSVDFTSLLRDSDIISLHIPGGANNNYLFGAQEMAAMKAGACIINTARGELIDESALIDSLASQHLGGAALDTFEQEPYEGRLCDFRNVILTPHVGSYAAEARSNMEFQAADNLLKALQS